MNVSFENPDKVSGVMTITIEREDYQPELDKALKGYRKKAAVRGFRKGMAPMGMIVRMYGQQAKADVVDHIVSEKMKEYITTNKIMMLGHALPNAAQEQQDLTKDGPFTFIFDIAVAPEINIALDASDTIDHYTIAVDDAMVDNQVEVLRARAGHYTQADEYDETTNDMLKGTMREVDADGNAVEGGVIAEGASIMPQYIDESQKALFKGCKKGDTVRFNPKKAYPDRESEIASMLGIATERAKEMESDFTLTIDSISRYVKAEMGQPFFDQVMGEGKVSGEEEFRAKVRDNMRQQMVSQEDYRFLIDLRKYAEDKAGDVPLSKELMRRLMQEGKEEAVTDEQLEANIKEMRWYLVRGALVKANDIKVGFDDITDLARKDMRNLFAQYGMPDAPDDVINNAVERRMKDKNEVERYFESAIDAKLAAAIKNKVKLNEKTVSVDEFNKLFDNQEGQE